MCVLGVCVCKKQKQQLLQQKQQEDCTIIIRLYMIQTLVFYFMFELTIHLRSFEGVFFFNHVIMTELNAAISRVNIKM